MDISKRGTVRVVAAVIGVLAAVPAVSAATAHAGEGETFAAARGAVPPTAGGVRIAAKPLVFENENTGRGSNSAVFDVAVRLDHALSMTAAGKPQVLISVETIDRRGIVDSALQTRVLGRTSRHCYAVRGISDEVDIRTRDVMRHVRRGDLVRVRLDYADAAGTRHRVTRVARTRTPPKRDYNDTVLRRAQKSALHC